MVVVHPEAVVRASDSSFAMQGQLIAAAFV